jgi:preprotein translocase subunit SecE
VADQKVTRISAKDDKPKAVKAQVVNKKAPTKKSKAVKAPKQKKVRKESKNPFVRTMRSIGGYFAGAWFELKQVHWPTRRATWELTFAVIMFSLFFVVFIVLLDLLFQYLFELIIV